MYIKTERLIIRNCQMSDAEVLYKIKYDPQVLKYNSTFFKRDATIDDIKEAISYFMTASDSGNFNKEIYYAIALKETNTVIGVITVSIPSYLNEVQIGWMLCGEYTGKGYASEAGAAASDFLLDTYSLYYMIVLMDVDNPASFRTAQKSGFRLSEKRVGYYYFYSKFNVENFNEVSKYFQTNQAKVGSCYYYFRKYNPKTKIKSQFYGDTQYEGIFS
ncbi:MAG: hypothetical protein A2Y17_08495 [Clostridiales bacterium GWF2_38_85]|nr:MAG: hypothetical protein A2Y17_08495 [Clostridiales bacterium GWF2_38_85]HBL83768.1 hypothetical protein [Clostridiales bacterium]